jgi:hypothetical protein
VDEPYALVPRRDAPDDRRDVRAGDLFSPLMITFLVAGYAPPWLVYCARRGLRGLDDRVAVITMVSWQA